MYSKNSKDGFTIVGRMEAVGAMEKKRKINKDDGTWAWDHGRSKKNVYSWESTPNTVMVEVDEEAKQNSAPIPSFAMGVKEDAKQVMGTKQKLKVMACRKFTKNGSLGMEIGSTSGGASQELEITDCVQSGIFLPH